jgi:hypothetical protein
VRSPAIIAGFAVALAGPVAAIWIWHSNLEEPALLTGALVGWALIALVALTALAREPGERLLPNSSLATVLIAIGLAMILNGLAFGLWLILIGAEVTLLGLAALVGELLGPRRGRG